MGPLPTGGADATIPGSASDQEDDPFAIPPFLDRRRERPSDLPDDPLEAVDDPAEAPKEFAPAASPPETEIDPKAAVGLDDPDRPTAAPVAEPWPEGMEDGADEPGHRAADVSLASSRLWSNAEQTYQTVGAYVRAYRKLMKLRPKTAPWLAAGLACQVPDEVRDKQITKAIAEAEDAARVGKETLAWLEDLVSQLKWRAGSGDVH